MIVSYFIGGRDGECAMWFVDDLRSRLANSVQLTSDGHKAYLEAVEGAFGQDIDYAILHFMGLPLTVGRANIARQNVLEPRNTALRATLICSTFPQAYVECSNLTMRMHMHHFTRLTNGFSKKVENHAYAVALHRCIIISCDFIPNCTRRPQWLLA